MYEASGDTATFLGYGHHGGGWARSLDKARQTVALFCDVAFPTAEADLHWRTRWGARLPGDRTRWSTHPNPSWKHALTLPARRVRALAMLQQWVWNKSLCKTLPVGRDPGTTPRTDRLIRNLIRQRPRIRSLGNPKWTIV